jgi:hypothetical protein
MRAVEELERLERDFRRVRGLGVQVLRAAWRRPCPACHNPNSNSVGYGGVKCVNCGATRYPYDVMTDGAVVEYRPDGSPEDLA